MLYCPEKAIRIKNPKSEILNPKQITNLKFQTTNKLQNTNYKMQTTNKIYIDLDKCLGCGECKVTCKYSAISWGDWDTTSLLQEKMVEFAYGAIKGKKDKVGFFNFILEVSPDCDCWNFSDPSIVEDLGILASFDPVAIDQASVDLVNQTPGIKGTKLINPNSQDKFKTLYPKIDWAIQLKYAEKIGLGSREYELIQI